MLQRIFKISVHASTLVYMDENDKFNSSVYTLVYTHDKVISFYSGCSLILHTLNSSSSSKLVTNFDKFIIQYPIQNL